MEPLNHRELLDQQHEQVARESRERITALINRHSIKQVVEVEREDNSRD